jgi:hypothetical protein
MKALFLVLFVPMHSFVTMFVLQRGFNPPAGGHGGLFTAFAALITSPVLLPLLMFDPDGERLAMWVQILSVPVNSLVWGIGVLLVLAVVKRCRGHKIPE